MKTPGLHQSIKNLQPIKMPKVIIIKIFENCKKEQMIQK